jgi:heme exporter protein A
MSATFSGTELACLRGERLVFRGVAFAIPEGGALFLHGPNGSGKSSLMRLMAGLGLPAEGQIAWDGEPIADDPDAHRARLHYVGHLDAVKPTLTVAENIAFHAALRGEAMKVDPALDAFALEPLADQPGRFLSQGQRRRVALARLLATHAPLWLLDEPTLGLDHASVARLGAAIAAHRASGGRVAIATHVAFDLPGADVLDLGAA